jgi:hypothetical protein
MNLRWSRLRPDRARSHSGEHSEEACFPASSEECWCPKAQSPKPAAAWDSFPHCWATSLWQNRSAVLCLPREHKVRCLESAAAEESRERRCLAFPELSAVRWESSEARSAFPHLPPWS